MSMNGINNGHSSNTGIIHGASGNTTSGGFGPSSTNGNAFTSGFAQTSHGVGTNNTISNNKGITLQNLIESNNYQDLMAMNGATGSSGGGWSTGDSHDSGIGGSPPFDGIRGSIGGLSSGNNIMSSGVGSGGMCNNTRSGGNHNPLLSHQTSLPLSSEGIGNQRGSGPISGSGLGSSSLLWGELNKALGGLDLSSSTASSTSNAVTSNQMHQLQENVVLNNEINKQHYTNVGARSSLDLGSLGRSDQLRDQSASTGASSLASQLLQHQQQNMACGGTGTRSVTARDILSDMDSTGNTNACNIRGVNSSSSLLQQNLEDLLQHQNQNIARVTSSGSSTISSSSPPDSLQHGGGMMTYSSKLMSINVHEPQNIKISETDQSGLEKERDDLAFANTATSSATVSSLPSAIPKSNNSVHTSKEEPEHNAEDARSGLCAI